ncbi:MAG: right-handed parallel beta-helix repeat-containing protein [bacterium]
MRTMRRTIHLAVAIGALLIVTGTVVACGDSSGNDNQNNAACGEGYEAQWPACVPIFDDCSGPAEISVLGGGCKAVGVMQCAAGFDSDGAGGCDPILPAQDCPPGFMEVLGQTDCQAVGVMQCAAGFEPDGTGGCDAILPSAPCAADTMEVLGQPTCQPISDCGSGTWGGIITDPTTVYVDQTADATGADGSMGAPFTTIAAALAVVPPSGQIAVAAGLYVERLIVGKSIRLEGRCAEQVTIQGDRFLGQDRPPVTLNAGASGTTVRGVTLTGAAEGLLIDGPQDVTIQETRVAGAGFLGIVLINEAEALLSGVLVDQSTLTGVHCEGCTLEVSDSVVRNTQSESQGSLGIGIAAQCDAYTGHCGALTVRRTVVQGNRYAGVSVTGVQAALRSSVVRDTVADDDGTAGHGIQAQRDTTYGVSGALDVESCLVSGNHEAGIIVEGVDTTVVSTVVRDTTPGEDDLGPGITSQCEPADGTCATLTVTDSLVENSQRAGIFALGVDAEVTSTIVRDTQAYQTELSSGAGIAALCDRAVDSCTRMRIDHCSLTGNGDQGVLSEGADTTVLSTLVRGTVSVPNGTSGRGIAASCDTGRGVCGTLGVESSVFDRNRYAGIETHGVETIVSSSLVRNTQPQEVDGIAGFGLAAACHQDLLACAAVGVVGSVFDGNAEEGIIFVGMDGDVASTVVRNTRSGRGDILGRGIAAECHPDAGCGSLTVSDSAVIGNRAVGVSTTCVEGAVRGTIVSETLPEVSSDEFGRGIMAMEDIAYAPCPTLAIEECLVAGNIEVGVSVHAMSAAVISTTIRDTLPNGLGMIGRGIVAQCSEDTPYCGSLTVQDSVVRASENLGIFIAGVTSAIRGTAVLQTTPNGSGDWGRQYGQAVFAGCWPEYDICGTLELGSCLLDQSYSAGLALQGVSGRIDTSVIRQVSAQPLDDKYGYGIQVEGVAGRDMPVFHVNDCEIRDAKLAGILYYRALGTLARSVVSGGENSVIMNEGSSPTILDDNDLSGTVTNEPTWANLYPSPAPEPPMPLGN